MDEFVKLIQWDQLNTEQKLMRYMKTNKYPMEINKESIMKEEIIEELRRNVEDNKIGWRDFLNEYRILLENRGFESEEEITDEESEEE